jgi:hypothetical protein
MNAHVWAVDEERERERERKRKREREGGERESKAHF